MNKIPSEYLFLINEGSGTDSDIDWQETLTAYFTPKSKSFEIMQMPKDIDIPKLRKAVLDKKPTYLIAVGGDGTVSLAANILAGTGITLGIIPQGSANGMAKELNVSENLEEALQVLTDNITINCDLIYVDGHCYGMHMADAGLNAQLIKYFDEGKQRGMLGYTKVILKTLWRKRKLKVNFTTDLDEQKNIEAYMVVLANASKYGTGAVINPIGKLDDGLFEIVIVRKLNVGSLLQMLFKPALFNPEKIEIFKASAVSIESRNAMHFQIDGEYKGRVKKVDARIEKHAVKVIVGKDTIEEN